MSTDLNTIIEDMYVNVIASNIATILRMKPGYIFINLQGVNLTKLEQAIHMLLDADFNVQTKQRNQGLEIIAVPKSK